MIRARVRWDDAVHSSMNKISRGRGGSVLCQGSAWQVQVARSCVRQAAQNWIFDSFFHCPFCSISGWRDLISMQSTPSFILVLALICFLVFFQERSQSRLGKMISRSELQQKQDLVYSSLDLMRTHGRYRGKRTQHMCVDGAEGARQVGPTCQADQKSQKHDVLQIQVRLIHNTPAYLKNQYCACMRVIRPTNNVNCRCFPKYINNLSSILSTYRSSNSDSECIFPSKYFIGVYNKN